MENKEHNPAVESLRQEQKTQRREERELTPYQKLERALKDTGDDASRIANSPQLEGFRARGIEVLLLSDPIDSFWASAVPDFEGKPFKSVTQGSADLGLIPLLEGAAPPSAETSEKITALLASIKEILADEVADVRSSDRLTESAVCLVASDIGPDRQFERLLSAAGRVESAAKPILEVNQRHAMVSALASTEDHALRSDVAHLLLDTAHILDGERPAEANAFAERLSRLVTRSLGNG